MRDAQRFDSPDSGRPQPFFPPQWQPEESYGSIDGSRSGRCRIGLEVGWALTDAVTETASRGVGYRW
jgi:hypothetical protein